MILYYYYDIYFFAFGLTTSLRRAAGLDAAPMLKLPPAALEPPNNGVPLDDGAAEPNIPPVGACAGAAEPNIPPVVAAGADDPNEKGAEPDAPTGGPPKGPETAVLNDDEDADVGNPPNGVDVGKPLPINGNDGVDDDVGKPLPPNGNDGVDDDDGRPPNEIDGAALPKGTDGKLIPPVAVDGMAGAERFEASPEA